MPRPVLFPPLENGLDYMEDAIDRLRGNPDSRDLKYGVLHLAAAIEVLLKMRLIKEHWSLIFEQVSTASLAKYESGDFKSVNSAEALRRLRDIASVPVMRVDEIHIENIVKKRNRLQHFGLGDSAESIQAVTAAALDYLLDFVDIQLRDPNGSPGDPVEETLDRIREQLAEIDALVQTRMESLKDGLDSSEVVLSCPSCTLSALVPGEPCKCLYCLRESQPEEMAEEEL
jgi:chorismate mutase